MKHKVIFIPWVRHAPPSSKTEDVYGHADGFVKYCGDNKILMTNHRMSRPDEADAIREVLENHGFEVTEMLFDVPKPDPDLNWAYINFFAGRQRKSSCLASELTRIIRLKGM